VRYTTNYAGLTTALNLQSIDAVVQEVSLAQPVQDTGEQDHSGEEYVSCVPFPREPLVFEGSNGTKER
jgi:hypothetical protein